MTDCCTDTEWIQARIDATKALIVKYEEAMLAIGGGAQSYTIETGQTRQVVTKANVTEARRALESLESRLAYYQGQLCGTGVTRVIPSY